MSKRRACLGAPILEKGDISHIFLLAIMGNPVLIDGHQQFDLFVTEI